MSEAVRFEWEHTKFPDKKEEQAKADNIGLISRKFSEEVVLTMNSAEFSTYTELAEAQKRFEDIGNRLAILLAENKTISEKIAELRDVVEIRVGSYERVGRLDFFTKTIIVDIRESLSQNIDFINENILTKVEPQSCTSKPNTQDDEEIGF